MAHSNARSFSISTKTDANISVIDSTMDYNSNHTSYFVNIPITSEMQNFETFMNKYDGLTNASSFVVEIESNKTKQQELQTKEAWLSKNITLLQQQFKKDEDEGKQLILLAYKETDSTARSEIKTVKDFLHYIHTLSIANKQLHHSCEIENLDKNTTNTLLSTPRLVAECIPGTAFPEAMKTWNLATLENDLNRTGENALFWTCDPSNPNKNKLPFRQPGYNIPVISVEQKGSIIPLQMTEHCLGQISYLHHGGPRLIYTIPGEYLEFLEDQCFMNSFTDRLTCKEFKFRVFPNQQYNGPLIQQKNVLPSLEFLDKNHIPYVKTTQKEGEYLVIPSGQILFGVNTGDSVTEKCLFHTKQTFKHFLMHELANNEGPAIRLPKENVVLKYQPNRFKDFINGTWMAPNPFTNLSQLEEQVPTDT